MQKERYDELAAYNRFVNLRLYAEAATLPDEVRKRPIGLFFKSLHGTLNHLLVADYIWLRRMTGDGPQPENSLLMVQGPLLLDWNRRKWKLFPGMENACIQGNQAPTMARVNLWLKARIQVPGRPDWYFVKLHTHGANEKNMPVLLGEPMVRFHQDLKKRADNDANFRYRYLTAREMAALILTQPSEKAAARK